MNRWSQTKQYTCPRCGASYLHDLRHQHHCFECPFRPMQWRPVLLMKIYEPRIGR
jgi:predicted amidophosphoribosyltransferase